MTEKPFDPESPSKDTLAGINVEMQGTIDRSIKPAPPSLVSQLPTAEAASINFEMNAPNSPRDIQS